MLKSSKALQFIFMVGLCTTVIGIPALLLFVVALKWVFLIYPAVFIGLVLLVSYIAAICLLYDDIFGSGRDRRFLEAETIPVTDNKEFREVYREISRAPVSIVPFYDNFAPICNSLGIQPPLNESEASIRFSEMFVILADSLKDISEKIKPIDLYNLWVQNKLLIVQLDEDYNIVYNYDIITFTSSTYRDDQCRIYIITNDGKTRFTAKGTREELIYKYNLTEVKTK
nr:MAG TPA: hypothetical protein [Caudoviricetes sp.]